MIKCDSEKEKIEQHKGITSDDLFSNEYLMRDEQSFLLHVSYQVAVANNEVVAYVTLSVFFSLRTEQLARLNNLKHVCNTQQSTQYKFKLILECDVWICPLPEIEF